MCPHSSTTSPKFQEEVPAEAEISTEKKKVQIIKSKGAVEPVISEAAKKKAEEEEKIRSKNDELLEKGRAYAENAEKESAENEEKSENSGDEKAEPEKTESVKKTGNQNNSKPKNGKKKKKK